MNPETNVVALLTQQHGEIRNLFDRVEETRGDERRDAFRELVRMLAVHETAEEEVLHPYTRRMVDGGAGVADDRLEEERRAKELLSRLDDMDTEDPDFMPSLLTLRMAVMEHARAEERYEFTHLLRTADEKQLAAMAKAVKAAEGTAPTRPHPGVETGAKNVALGPLAAVTDRARDAARKAMDGRGDR